MQEPRSLRRGLLAAVSVLMLTAALLVVGSWSPQGGGTLAMAGWIAAVVVGAMAYRGRPPVVRILTRLALVAGIASLALALALLFIGFQVRELLGGTVAFGSAGAGCTLEGSGTTFTFGEPVYQVAYLSRRVEPGEVVTLTMTRDGMLLAQGSSTAASSFDCVGAPLEPPGPGTYDVSVSAEDEVLASGTLEVRSSPA